MPDVKTFTTRQVSKVSSINEVIDFKAWTFKIYQVLEDFLFCFVLSHQQNHGHSQFPMATFSGAFLAQHEAKQE